ncbi:MAG: ABC transporter ATP-binding protein [Thermodesulfobacteriota bacterium]
MKNSPIIKTNQLSKNFGDYRAVREVDISVYPGEIFGFLGPNGAGKTTTIKMLTGLLLPSSGSLAINGMEMADAPEQCKAVTGYIPDRPFLYEKLTGMEYLHFIASLYPAKGSLDVKKEAAHYLELFDLLDWQDNLIEGYSHGMKQKLIMTSIFILGQDLIVVDEPMVGLDPKSARIVKELFKEKASQGGTIFLSTHSLEIAEELCDRIAIILQGRIVTSGTLAEIRQQAGNSTDNLEDIFLQLTGSSELQAVVQALHDERDRTGQQPGPA